MIIPGFMDISFSFQIFQQMSLRDHVNNKLLILMRELSVETFHFVFIHTMIVFLGTVIL